MEEAYRNNERDFSVLPYPDISDFLFLLKCILKNSYFEFNEKYRKQIIGCAVGSTVSPEVVDFRMSK